MLDALIPPSVALTFRRKETLSPLKPRLGKACLDSLKSLLMKIRLIWAIAMNKILTRFLLNQPTSLWKRLKETMLT